MNNDLKEIKKENKVEDSNFIKTIIKNDLENGVHTKIITRFPPEPNAYLHIGHARAIITNFELAKTFGGITNLRFDDTNPAAEDQEYVEGIIEDLAWLGYTPANIFYGSSYFEATYEKAILFIKKGLAYVCDLTNEELASQRGDINNPGTESPYRNRSVEENLELFEKMRQGVYKNGEKTLRAKIDMASPNMNMRDPVIYRILHMNHHQTHDKWCIYPMYDFAHPLQDAIEGITHSLCSIEYEDHRPLYDWVIEHAETEHKPRQIEFGRLGITNMIMSKRYLRQIVNEKIVKGYDDPRLSTLTGLRRRGFTKDAIREFILSTGLSKINSIVDYGTLEHFLREDLKLKTTRPMAVLEPLLVKITNLPDDYSEVLTVTNNSENPELGSHEITFSNRVYIEKSDFLETAPDKSWKRLSKGLEVRLMHAYFIKCEKVVYNESGLDYLECTYDPITKSGSGFKERKPNGTIHFVDAKNCLEADFNIFEPLILDEKVSTANFKERINSNSWTILSGVVQKSVGNSMPLDKYQFVRNGYFSTDYNRNAKGNLVFNRIVSLKSSFDK